MFIHDDFLLSNDHSRRLYHRFAAKQPIIDYHNHLSPADIASDRRFANLFEMWLDHDHYKWRAMRANGIDESLITGDADPKEKFLAFAWTVPHTLRNPLYHWTHLELKRYFGIDKLLSESTAEMIWQDCNDQIANREELSTNGILKQFEVQSLCTTDDPVDSLEHHRKIADSRSSKMEFYPAAVYPTFRPDWALFVDRPAEFQAWIRKLEAASDVNISTLGDMLEALKQRHDYFHSLGTRLSDHGCEYVPASFCDHAAASKIFAAALAGTPATPEQFDQYATFVLLELARMDQAKGWTQQIHTGVWRNNSTRLFRSIGRDVGCDSMADTPQGRSLGLFLDRLDQDGTLPKTIVYNLNPTDNYLISTMLGNFQDGSTAGKMQFGTGWWFLDQKDGMEMQMNALSSTGLISRFVGMLTDSRSFMSFPRHEYFRRILCDLFGKDIQAGLIPDDDSLNGRMIERICYGNARDFLGLGAE